MAPNGKPFTSSSIGAAIATRAIMADLRAGGDQIGRPRPFSSADRSVFLQALDRELVALKRLTQSWGDACGHKFGIEDEDLAGDMHNLPLIAPQPPRLSAMIEALHDIEARASTAMAVRSSAFEARAVAELFGGEGAALAVNNATIGLILAIRRGRPGPQGAMPCPAPQLHLRRHRPCRDLAGLAPILLDSDPDDWAASAGAEEGRPCPPCRRSRSPPPL